MENKKNYQLEMEKSSHRPNGKETSLPSFFIAAVLPAAAMFLSTCPNISKLQFFIIIPISIPAMNMRRDWERFGVWSGRYRRAILWNLWRVITGRRNFFRWRRDMRKTKRGANAVPYALECGFMRRQSWPKRGDLTGSRQPSPSVR